VLHYTSGGGRAVDEDEAHAASLLRTVERSSLMACMLGNPLGGGKIGEISIGDSREA